VVDEPLAECHDPQALVASESVAQALRQLEVYGRDGLPVVSPDGLHVEGWITSGTVLRALAHQITGTQAAVMAQAAVDGNHGDDDAEAILQNPPAPLAGYQVAEITVAGGSPAAGRKLHEVAWPQAGIPVSLLRGRRLGPPDPGIILAEGDRVGLLIPAPPGPDHQHPAGRPQGLSAADTRGER
jgi:CIC family chloride channel protein